ncbi:AAA family ATPase [Bremerella alba]|uniref:ATPase AAA-type core domain-containing protein n=1 Tax=Bremerella alba TaxID=980252 RepID=A0A7V9A8X3_9BACT|nr:AAA family ATPase [Bremerella alba]MBA2116872.1 hypothetical protein [Bremerella alba]
MTDFSRYSLKLENLKCFGVGSEGFESIKPINIIIGRNNAGKSTLLDIIPSLTNDRYECPSILRRNNNKDPCVYLGVRLTPDLLARQFKETERGGAYVNFRNLQHFSQRLHDLNAILKFSPRGLTCQTVEKTEEWSRNLLGNGIADCLNRVGLCITNPFLGLRFHRLHPDRSLKPEEDRPLDVIGDGTGATTAIQRYLTKDHLPPELIQKTLLNQLNEIVQPDAEFSEIVVRQDEDSKKWEVFLNEVSKGRIRLSQSGHGLQSIILVLVHTIVLTHGDGDGDLSGHLFGFEELENNLHPALLRRLLKYLSRIARNHGGTFFLTTHSHVAIDMFRRDSEAQILHVTHDGDNAKARTLTTYIHHNGVLDDLDIRASDILQANCVIWVEGPSDRIYVNRWIEIASNGELEEGIHYQCVFYGGRLLAHLNGSDPDELDDEGVKILRLNRKACIIIDSDKRAQQTPINLTKRRIEQEVNEMGGEVWITKGKEVENYVPALIFQNALELTVEPQVGLYDDAFTKIECVAEGVGERYRKKKPLLAEKVTTLINEHNWVIHDLDQQVMKICDRIRVWNNVREN